jgi:hypothetical protein
MFTGIFRIIRGVILGVVTVTAVMLLGGCSRPEVNVKLFEDVTAQSGLEAYRGMTYGAAWGDFNGDGLPDLYVTNHWQSDGAKLFRNMGKGHFEDVTDEFFVPQDLTGDKHGAVWADFNNDGRPDLVQMTGGARGIGSEPKRLFLNRGRKFEDVAEALGVSNPYDRARMPLWYDYNRDGLLDLFEGAERRLDDRKPPFVFLQHSGKFTVAANVIKFASRSPKFCIITALNSDYHSDLVCRVAGKHVTAQVFNTTSLPAREVKNALPHTAFQDIAAADFDNDGKLDLFMARKNPPGPVAFGRTSNDQFITDVWIDRKNVDKTTGFAFRTSGKLAYQVDSRWPKDALSVNQIHLGKQGVSPGKFKFTLPDGVVDAAGMTTNEPGKQAGVYVGMTSPGKWEVRVTAPRKYISEGKSNYQEIQIKVTASQPITDLEAIGEPVAVEDAPARLFMNRGGKLIEESDKRGVNARLVAGVNVVAGDFDNDMHEDLFVLASSEIGQEENLLLLNRGDGHFDVVHGAGGAGGDLSGVGDSVTTVDYDGDGSLDLLTTTGGSMGRSEGLPADNGRYHLYHNVGNRNHWIEIDLEGTKSNRDGIGAVVEVVAGGVTQTQVQDDGVHFRAQNSQRLHFGLARNTRVDKITVHWPSGTVQELDKVPGDQILRIKEPQKAMAATDTAK